MTKQGPGRTVQGGGAISITEKQLEADLALCERHTESGLGWDLLMEPLCRTAEYIKALKAEREKFAKMIVYVEQVEKQLAGCKEDLRVTQEIGDSFWAALKPLNLQAIYVTNPGLHVTELIEENDRLRKQLLTK